MDVKAATSGLTKYVVMLVQTVLFPLYWLKALKVAKAHKEFDPHSNKKVALGIAIGIAFAAIGYMGISNIQSNGDDGMYDSMDARLQQATRETEYQDQVALIEATEGQVATITRNIQAAVDARDDAMSPEAAAENQTIIDGLQVTLTDAQSTLRFAQENRTRLVPNHEFYQSIQPLIAAKDDAGIKQALLGAPENTKQKSAARAFDLKADAEKDMAQVMNYLVLPGLFGALLGPVVIALGSVLKSGFEPSDTVGFKPYPGGSMGAFLILGGFGIPSIFFAAWTMVDVEARTVEPQIAL